MGGLTRDFGLLGAVVVVIAGVAAALILRGLWVKIVALAIALLVATWMAGLLPDF
jgi:hypothetical protein